MNILKGILNLIYVFNINLKIIYRSNKFIPSNLFILNLNFIFKILIVKFLMELS